MEQNKPTSIQSFIEMYYPDYDGSNNIAWCEDLYKLIVREYQPKDCAYQLLVNDYENDIDHPQIIEDYNRLRVGILEAAIEGYIESIK